MRKLLIVALLVSGAAAAAPANAQSSRYQGGHHIQRELDQIVQRIHRAEDRDIISKREEDRLLREARFIDRLYDRYRRNGLNRREGQELQNRLQTLRQHLRFERREDRRDYDRRR